MKRVKTQPKRSDALVFTTQKMAGGNRSRHSFRDGVIPCLIWINLARGLFHGFTQLAVSTNDTCQNPASTSHLLKEHSVDPRVESCNSHAETAHFKKYVGADCPQSKPGKAFKAASKRSTRRRLSLSWNSGLRLSSHFLASS